MRFALRLPLFCNVKKKYIVLVIRKIGLLPGFAGIWAEIFDREAGIVIMTQFPEKLQNSWGRMDTEQSMVYCICGVLSCHCRTPMLCLHVKNWGIQPRFRPQRPWTRTANAKSRKLWIFRATSNHSNFKLQYVSIWCFVTWWQNNDVALWARNSKHGLVTNVGVRTCFFIILWQLLQFWIGSKTKGRQRYTSKYPKSVNTDRRNPCQVLLMAGGSIRSRGGTKLMADMTTFWSPCSIETRVLGNQSHACADADLQSFLTWHMTRGLKWLANEASQAGWFWNGATSNMRYAGKVCFALQHRFTVLTRANLQSFQGLL